MKKIFDIKSMHGSRVKKHRAIASAYSIYFSSLSRDAAAAAVANQIKRFNAHEIKKEKPKFSLIYFDIKGYYDSFNFEFCEKHLKETNKFIYKRDNVRAHLKKLINGSDCLLAGMPLANTVGEIVGTKIEKLLMAKVENVFKIVRYVDDYVLFVKGDISNQFNQISGVLSSLGFMAKKIVSPTKHVNFLGYKISLEQNGKIEMSNDKIVKRISPFMKWYSSMNGNDQKDFRLIFEYYLSGQNAIHIDGVEYATKIGILNSYKLIKRNDFTAQMKIVLKDLGMNDQAIQSIWQKADFSNKQLSEIFNKIRLKFPNHKYSELNFIRNKRLRMVMQINELLGNMIKENKKIFYESSLTKSQNC